MRKEKGHENLLTITEAMQEFNIKFKKSQINIIEGFAGSGKTYFLMNEFINNTVKYTNWIGYNNNLKNCLSKVLYVCDTRMLKDSILHDNKLIAESLSKGGLIEAKNSDNLSKHIEKNTGTIKIITYQTLGFLLSKPNAKYMIETYFKCIIMDEIHNLFNYYYKYNSTELSLLISSLNTLSSKILLIGLTASPQPIKNYQYNNSNELNINYVFSNRQINKLDRHFAYNKKYYHCGWNMIKDVNWEFIKQNKCKVLIYTDFITVEKKYKDYIQNLGLKAEWLCSPTNEIKYEDIDLNTGEIVEKSQITMTNEQMKLREYLINNNEIPEELDVLIINASYQTGWNLRDLNKKVQVVLIDSSKEDVHIQAVRVRHDIAYLGMKWTNIDNEGRMLYKNGNSKQEYFYEVGAIRRRYCDEEGNLISYTMFVDVPNIKLPKEYLGIKLTKEIKKEIVYKYGYAPIGKTESSWKDVKNDLLSQGYIIDTTKGNGTYIYTKDKIIKKDSKKVVNKMNKLIDFLVKHEGKKLTDKEKNKLIDLVNARNAKGELLKTIGKVNKQLDIYEVGFSIVSIPTNGVRYWQITSIE